MFTGSKNRTGLRTSVAFDVSDMFFLNGKSCCLLMLNFVIKVHQKRILKCSFFILNTELYCSKICTESQK